MQTTSKQEMNAYLALLTIQSLHVRLALLEDRHIHLVAKTHVIELLILLSSSICS